MPPAVVISASEIAGATTANPLWPVMPICRNDPRMPTTVPKSPTNGIHRAERPQHPERGAEGLDHFAPGTIDASATRSCRFARSKAARYSATVGTWERSGLMHGDGRIAAEQRPDDLLVAIPRLGRETAQEQGRVSMPMITAAIDPARMISLVTTITGPPLFSISSSSCMGLV